MASTEKPRAHVIEPAKSGRSTCQSCGVKIEDGDLRLSEAYVTDEGRWARSHRTARQPRASEFSDDNRYDNYNSTNPDVWARFHHLECAAQHQPFKLRSALAASTIEIPNRAELELAMDRALSSRDVAEENEATREEYARFLEKLREAHDDDMLLVFGDWLQSIADPRGELVSVQHGAETAKGEEKLRLADVEKKLLAVHRKSLTPDRIEGTITWRRGFIYRAVLNRVDTTLQRTFEHPSFRLLRELSTPALPTPLPATLTKLELHNAQDLSQLKHSTLPELVLVYGRRLADLVGLLDRKRLPKLQRLHLRVDNGLDFVLRAFSETKFLKKLHTLGLHGDLSVAGLEFLKGVKVDVLDVRGTKLGSADMKQLKKHGETVLVDEVAAPAAPALPKKVGEWLVRHTRRPEWGTGRVVEETDDGLQVEFENGGAKLVRNVELLEEVADAPS